MALDVGFSPGVVEALQRSGSFLRPVFVPLQAVSSMQSSHRKARALCAVMMCVCVLMGTSWKLSHRLARGPAPAARFWRQHSPSAAFWNREQQRLDILNNPLINGTLGSPGYPVPDWLNDTGPLDPCQPDTRVPRQVLDFGVLPQRFQDFLLHMRCRTYPLLMERPQVCEQTPFLLLAIKSLAPHFDRRQAIRQTWGRAGSVANRSVVTVFLLGSASPADGFPDLQGLLVHESATHKDLLQWDYRDSFFNLTLKEVLFLDWFRTHCPHAHFVLKGDDDVFVNTVNIVAFLQGLPGARAKDLFVGDVIRDASPHRDKNLKYFIPESVFVGAYPPYAGGGGYLLSGDLALRLHSISQQVLLYPIDDVFTGMCLRRLGLAPEPHRGFRTFGLTQRNALSPCVHRGLMLVHGRSPQDMLRLWPWVSRPERSCQ